MSKANDNKGIKIAFASLVVTTLSLGYGVLHDHSVKKSNDTRFASIETSLRLLTGTVAPQLQKAIDDSLAFAISAPTSKAGDKIAFVGAAIQQLSEANASLPVDAVKRTGDQLSAVAQIHSNLPETWATIGGFLAYRSIIVSTSPDKTRQLLTEKINDCTDSLPKPGQIAEVLSPHQAVVSNGIYENCRFVIDSPVQDQRINDILKQNAPFLTFRNCLIEYHGGEINLILAWDKMPYTFTFVSPNPEDKTLPKVVHTNLSGSTIKFEDCLLDFLLPGPPPRRGQQISTALLEQNTPSVALPLSN